MFERFTGFFGTPGLLAGLALIMAALYGADQFLANLERRETGAEARHLAQKGEDLLRRGQVTEAIDAFDRAHLTERDNRYYTLALARALVIAHQPEKAVTVLQDVLDDDSNDGEANLLMARAMTEDSHFNSAESYYHRAIYGSWPSGQADQSVKARVELVRWLTEHGDRQSLLAELIPLEQRAKSDSAIAHQIPELYLQAGSVSEAEEAYRALIHQNPADSEAYAGLGRVELKRGNFRAAEQDFIEALAHKTGDSRLTKEVALAKSAHELDPTPRRLTSAEMVERSTQVLQLTLDVTQNCSGSDAEAIQSAKQMLAGKTPKSATNEMAGARLDLAEKVWKSRPSVCPADPEKVELLGLLMRKIEQ